MAGTDFEGRQRIKAAREARQRAQDAADREAFNARTAVAELPADGSAAAAVADEAFDEQHNAAVAIAEAPADGDADTDAAGGIETTPTVPPASVPQRGGDIFATMATIERARKADAERRYVELLEPADPAPSDAIELHDLGRRMGKTVDDVRRDHRLVQEVKQLEELAGRLSEFQSQLPAARDAAAEHLAEIRRVVAERGERQAQLQQRLMQVESQVTNAEEAGKRLYNLAAEHPTLLGHRAADRRNRRGH